MKNTSMKKLTDQELALLYRVDYRLITANLFEVKEEFRKPINRLLIFNGQLETQNILYHEGMPTNAEETVFRAWLQVQIDFTQAEIDRAMKRVYIMALTLGSVSTKDIISILDDLTKQP